MNDAGPSNNNPCDGRKTTVDNPITDGDGKNVIVLNPDSHSVCNLQCAVGWYHDEYGNAAPFLCAAETANRKLREGIPKYPITCTSSFVCCFLNLYSAGDVDLCV